VRSARASARSTALAGPRGTPRRAATVHPMPPTPDRCCSSRKVRCTLTRAVWPDECCRTPVARCRPRQIDAARAGAWSARRTRPSEPRRAGRPDERCRTPVARYTAPAGRNSTPRRAATVHPMPPTPNRAVQARRHRAGRRRLPPDESPLRGTGRPRQLGAACRPHPTDAVRAARGRASRNVPRVPLRAAKAATRRPCRYGPRQPQRAVPYRYRPRQPQRAASCRYWPLPPQPAEHTRARRADRHEPSTPNRSAPITPCGARRRPKQPTPTLTLTPSPSPSPSPTVSRPRRPTTPAPPQQQQAPRRTPRRAAARPRR
jgi:hypothetical protein